VVLGQVLEVDGGKVRQVSTHLGEEVRITHSCLCLASDEGRWEGQVSRSMVAVKGAASVAGACE
jgi:hypothetical protein